MNNRKIKGVWRFTQKWGNFSPNSFDMFDAEFLSNGCIIVKDQLSTFYGTYQMLEDTGYLSLALGNFEDHLSINSYAGNIEGYVMTGQMKAIGIGQRGSCQGEWSAYKLNTEITDLGIEMLQQESIENF